VHPLERWCLAIRHDRRLARADWLWKRVRPGYDTVTRILGRRGLVRVINGTDEIRISPTVRTMGEAYEPAVWAQIMAELRRGDTLVDVGAHLGLYTVAAARRVGSAGRVVAFEPDPESFALLAAHVRLNGVADRVELVKAAVGDRNGRVPFRGGRQLESCVLAIAPPGERTVPCVSLDDALGKRHVDVLKIDVEGYEVHVLRGARRLLRDPARRPRAVFLEIHPYAWAALHVAGPDLLAELAGAGYETGPLEHGPIRMDRWGELVARPVPPARRGAVG